MSEWLIQTKIKVYSCHLQTSPMSGCTVIMNQLESTTQITDRWGQSVPAPMSKTITACFPVFIYLFIFHFIFLLKIFGFSKMFTTQQHRHRVVSIVSWIHTDAVNSDADDLQWSLLKHILFICRLWCVWISFECHHLVNFKISTKWELYSNNAKLVSSGESLFESALFYS